MSVNAEHMLCIIPAYNEGDSVGAVVEELRRRWPRADCLVVDDGSKDQTGERARAAGASVCRLSYNLGIGAAVQTGLKYARDQGYGLAVQVDGDGQHPADQIARLVAELEADPQVDLVVGSRFLAEGGFKSRAVRRMGIGIFSAVLSLICRRRVTDPTSGFRAARGEVIDFLARFYPRDYPEVESLVILHRAGYVVREASVEMRERQGGRSSIGRLSALYYMVKVLLATFIELLKRPKGHKGRPGAFAHRTVD